MRHDERTAPTLVLIIGPPAVGKMTVGQALARLTDFRLFHLHQIVDLVLDYFPYSIDPESAYERLVVAYRRLFFEEAARSGLHVITTTGWRFDLPSEEEAVRRYVRPFLDHGGQVYAVELRASLETRLRRNLTENRRRHKRTDWSTEEALRQDADLHRYDSGGTLPLDLPLLRIDTDHLTADATAQRIRDHYGLP
jgi:chloramphenicol 3-O-phosphotransferase